jgi:uncharacterized protein (TIGR02246 family)
MKNIKTVLFLSLLLASFSTFADSCKKVNEREVKALFTRWNDSLQTLDYKKVVKDNYATDSILLPTVSNIPRTSVEGKEEYFHHFLEKHPTGEIIFSYITLGCNSAVDSGLYVFTFIGGEQVTARYSFAYAWNGKKWLIVSHHSSVLPNQIEAQKYNM